MPYRFADGVLVETTGADDRQVPRLGRDHPALEHPDHQGRHTPGPVGPGHGHEASPADDPTGLDDPWPLGAVVAFRRRKGSTGFGQIERATPTGLLTIRTWLPCPTRTVTLTPVDVRLVATLDDLYQFLAGRG